MCIFQILRVKTILCVKNTGAQIPSSPGIEISMRLIICISVMSHIPMTMMRGPNACRMESIYILHLYMCDRKPVEWSLKNISAFEFK